MLDHLVGLLERALNSQVTGTKPLQVHTKPEPELNADELALVKQVAKAMLETLKREKLVLDWRLKERAKAAVRSAIQQSLDALPPAYDDVIWQGKVAQTYEWIFDHYGGGASIN